MQSKPFPDRPDDILRLIFEIAVDTDIKDATRLVLVSRRVQRW